MSAEDLSEFLEAKVNYNPFKQPRSKGGYIPPEYNEDDFKDELLGEQERKGIERQFNETKEILSRKTLTDGTDVFYEVYTKARTSDQEVIGILNGLKAKVINYLDRKDNGILVLGTIEKFRKLSEGTLPKYITEKVRIIKPLTREEQLEEEISEDSEVKMLVFSIIPNLDTIKNKIYLNILQKFLAEKNSPTYGDEFHKFGFILADVTSAIVNELLEKSSFIFKINIIPEAIAQEIRESSSKTDAPSTVEMGNEVQNPNLPNVVLMDSGVNKIEQLLPVLKSRDSYVFENLDDEHNGDGHGTPIANLISYGENNQEPNSNIISYKIWTSQERKYAPLAFLSGIENYASDNKLFATSIGIPHFQRHFLAKMDKIIQEKNICFVASAGNLKFEEIQECLRSGGEHPHYLRNFPVTPPANALNIIAVGSFANKESKKFQSIASSGELSPHSRCGTGEYALFECKKPQIVEHGGNVNIIDADYNLNDQDVGVSTRNKNGQIVELTGSSFSSPLFVRRLAGLWRVYRSRIKNAETLMAISYLSCTNNFEGCAGFGAPADFTHCDKDTALYFAEGEMGFTQVSDDTITTPINEIIAYVPPNVHEIKLCLTHSDNLHKSVEPTLETYFKIETRKTGSGSLVPPINNAELDSKTNAKILRYRFDQRSMEGYWTFSIRPRPVNNLLSEDKRNITVRFGCAILLKRRPDKGSKKSLTQEIKENREKYS